MHTWLLEPFCKSARISYSPSSLPPPSPPPPPPLPSISSSSFLDSNHNKQDPNAKTSFSNPVLILAPFCAYFFVFLPRLSWSRLRSSSTFRARVGRWQIGSWYLRMDFFVVGVEVGAVGNQFDTSIYAIQWYKFEDACMLAKLIDKLRSHESTDVRNRHDRSSVEKNSLSQVLYLLLSSRHFSAS